MERIALIAGRVMIALIFVMAGASKLADIGGTAAYIENASPLPGLLAAPTGIYEVVAGVLLVLGRFEKINTALLAGFTLLTIVFFHADFADQGQVTLALKNVAIAGGLLVLFAHSAKAPATPYGATEA